MKALRSVTALFFLAVACGPLNSNPTWERCGGEVTVTVSAITLGDECGSAKAAPEFSDCANTGLWGGCGICRQSSVQLDIVSTSHSPASFEVRSVRLYDQSNALVATLTASEAKQFVNNQYQAWDQVIGGGTTLKTSYRLTAPNWSQIDANGAARSSNGGIGTGYKTQVDVAVDGELRTLSGPDAYRQPDVAT